MLDNKIIIEYREILLRYLEQKVTKPIDIGLSAALILLATPSNNNASMSIDEPALTLALEIDKKNSDKLPRDIQAILKELSLYLSNNVVIESHWQITRLTEAVGLLYQHPQLKTPPHVSTILSAIDRACQWTDEDLHTQEGKTVDIPTSGPQETIRCFHAHDHSGVQAKRNALNRLQHSMIAAGIIALKKKKD